MVATDDEYSYGTPQNGRTQEGGGDSSPPMFYSASEGDVSEDEEAATATPTTPQDDPIAMESRINAGLPLDNPRYPEWKESLTPPFSNGDHMYYPRKGFSKYSSSLKTLIPVRNSSPRCADVMPVDHTGLYSCLSFSWMTKFMWKAYKTGFDRNSLPACSPLECCNRNCQRLEFLWKEEVQRHGLEGASLKRIVWKFTRTRLLLGMFLFILSLATGFATPTIFMRKLLQYAQREDVSYSEGALWVFGLFLTEILRIIMFAGMWSVNYRTALRLRSGCLALLFNKVMKLQSLGDKSIGELINLFSNDGQRIFDFVIYGPLIVGGPVVAVGGTLYIAWFLGPPALLGMVTFIFFYPFQYLISRFISHFRRKTIRVTDERVRLMNELFTYVKLIKLYAWEKPFHHKISDIRRKEKKLLEKGAYVQSLSIAMAPTVPIIAAIVTFLAHLGAGNDLTAAEAFSVFGMYQAMKIAINFLPPGLRYLGELFPTLQRFQAFTVTIILTMFNFSLRVLPFYANEIVNGNIAFQRFQSVLLMEELKPYSSKPQNDTDVVHISGATFAWDVPASPTKYKDGKRNRKLVKRKHIRLKEERCEETVTLQIESPKAIDSLFAIDFTLEKGHLIGVCGAVGSGKSSLISAILGQMRLVSGKVALEGSCAYVCQQAWIINDTFKNNILFGEALEAKRYYEAIHCCGLNADVNSLPGGDDTEIGERGLNLSGGQKQRISLARAVYSNRDIYLLDDPLSAVDAQVGKHIFNHCIQGVLKGKSVVFVTHQLQYLSSCDQIILMKDGTIAERGTHEELMELDHEYANLIRTFHSEDKEEKKRNSADNNLVSSLKTPVPKKKEQKITFKEPNSNISSKEKQSKNDGPDIGKLTTAEKLEQGSIDSSTYRLYMRAAGGYLVSCFVLLSFALNIGSTAFSSWWLSVWINDGSGNTTFYDNSTNTSYVSTNISDNPEFHMYKLVYGLSIIAILVTSLLRGFLFMKATLSASSKLHDKVIAKIFRSPMRFFDVTPIGRILHIFSRDMDEIDIRLPFIAETFLQNLWVILFSLLFVCLVFPWFLIPLSLLSVVFAFLHRIFRVSIRQFKRFENVTKSPVYSHVTASVQGLSTIHAYQKEKDFCKKFFALMDSNTAPFYMFHCAMRWLGLRLDVLVISINVITGIFIVALHGQVPAAFAGLALAYAAQLTGLFQYTVRLSTESEARFTSVERIHNYICNLEMEAPEIIGTARPQPTWPDTGRIEFKDIKMRYRKELPLVLKGLSFTIEPREKIGIVGRTGSGKSSLGVCLFRLVELSSGKILLDDLDISKIGLEDLRSRMSLIPQDPVLFIGTVRYNLDPFNLYTDEEIWQSLQKTYMKEKISSLEKQLQAPVVENGDNFSVGERQLLCMARALLRKSKVLLLDEATAAIDTETDSLIQNTIRESFAECTILTIAHRLNTVLNCDRIMVLQDGLIIEMDQPSYLLSNPKSAFSRMMQAAESNFTAVEN